MNLTTEERRVLLDVLSMHIEGMDDARERMIEDTATLHDFDTFSETMQRHDIDTSTVESIRQKVIEEDDSSSVD